MGDIMTDDELQAQLDQLGREERAAWATYDFSCDKADLAKVNVIIDKKMALMREREAGRIKRV